MELLRGIWWFFKLFMTSVILAILIAGSATALAVTYWLNGLAKTLPPLTGLKPSPSITTKIYDVNGVVLDELFAEELREAIVPLAQIPKITQLAFIAIEDQRFYSHYGIDPKRILGALHADIVAKQAVQGASTLTQQLAKNLFLTREKTIERKVKEIMISIQLERVYTKDEILELYLNTIFFGHRVFGIASAAKYYFGKEPRQLDLAESALLAGLPKSPNRFSPFNKRWPNAWKDRQKTVLAVMLQQGHITQAEHDAAVKQQLKFAPSSAGSVAREAPHFLEFVKRQLLDRYGFKRVFASGLKVYTTLDVRVQRMAEKHFLNSDVFKSKPLDEVPDFQGAMVVMDATDGSLRAMVGGRDFELSKFNRAVQARRHPGSSFKPFVYAAAFRAGFTPSHTMLDAPYSIWDKGAQRWWTPGNYGQKFSNSNVTLADALARSLNVIAVKLAESVGAEKLVEMAQRLGITSPMTPNLSLALGACEVTLLEMVGAYATFANQGIRVKPKAITRVEDSEGRVIFEAEPQDKEVLDEKLAYTMVQVMRGVVERGTATRAKIDGYHLAGKTGTTQDFRDAWFLGVMPNLAIGAYVGYDEPRSMGREMTGGRLVAPVIGSFLREYVTQFPVPREFRPPPGTLVVQVCAANRMIPGAHCETKLSLPFDAASVPTRTCTWHKGPAEEAEYEDEEGAEESGMTPAPHVSRADEDEEDAMSEVRF